MYLKNRTIQDKSTKYRKISDNFLIFPKYRKYRTCGSSEEKKMFSKHPIVGNRTF